MLIPANVIPILKELDSYGPRPIQWAYKLDQRYLRSAYMRGWVNIAHGAIHITVNGSFVMAKIKHRELQLRKNLNRPLFKRK